MSLVYQILISIIALFYLGRSFSKIIKRQAGQSLLKVGVIVFVWAGVLVFTWYPKLAETINKTFGFGDNLNTLIFIGFVIVFALLFRVLGIIEKIENEIISLVRSQAIASMVKTPENVGNKKDLNSNVANDGK